MGVRKKVHRLQLHLRVYEYDQELFEALKDCERPGQRLKELAKLGALVSAGGMKAASKPRGAARRRRAVKNRSAAGASVVATGMGTPDAGLMQQLLGSLGDDYESN